MRKKKVLIVSYSYPPSNAPAAQRPYAVAKYLDKSKFEVTVLTCSNGDSSLGYDKECDSYLKGVKLINISGPNISSFRHSKTKKTEGFRPNKRNTFKQKINSILGGLVFPDKAISWYPHVLYYILKNKRNFKYDVIFSTSPLFTNHLIGRKVKKINKRAIHIADFRDYHYLENFDKKKNIKSFLHKVLERLILNKANKVTFISDAMKDVYGYAYPKLKKNFYTVYNGYDIENYQHIKPAVLSNNGPLRIFYAGSFYNGLRSPLPLLNILEKLIKTKLITTQDIRLEIAGNFEDSLLREIENLKIYDSIEFLGHLPRKDVLERYANSHLLWLIVGNEISHYTGVPIKFYEYLASKRPIINFAPNNSEPTKIIEKFNLGWSFDSININISGQEEIFKGIIKNYNDGELNYVLDTTNIVKYNRKNQTEFLQSLF